MRAAILLGALALLQACAAPGPAPDAAALDAVPPKGAAAPDTASLDATRLPAPALVQREVPAPAPVQTLDRTTPPDDLWERIRRGFAIQDLDNALVQEKTAYYASRPDYLQRIFDRSRLYLFHIVEEAEKRGLPTEVALLPMVESAFNPMAYSRAHASGLWQFIPGTGRRYELTQNWWYDGRRDVVASTNAALEYLTRLYEMHGDWQLALASYNWGEGAVSRAVEKNRKAGLPTDYESLRMPAETRHYIPKLQALKNIIRDPRPFGITLDPIPNQPYFATYEKLRDIDVQLAAKLAEMPVDEFVALNPAFSRPVIRASMAPRIVLPADKVDVFHANLEKHQKALVSWKSYPPKKGDTLESIAKKHGMTLAQLKEVNGIPARSRAVPSMLVVPTSPATAGSLARLPLQYAPPIPVVYRRIWHTVKAGETLASIAARYGVSTLDLRQWNPGAKVSTGQRLAVDVKATARSRPQQGKPKAKPKPRVYKKAER
jgi:membrane-bound lytic murein transglycosylase D